MFLGDWSNQARGTLFCVVGVSVLTGDAYWIRSVSDLSNFTVIFYRYLLFATTLSIYFTSLHGWKTWEKCVAIGGYGLLGGIVFGVSNVMVTLAFQFTSAANALVIIACSPFFSALFSFLILNEVIHVRTIVAAVLCFTAVFLVFYSSFGSDSWSDTQGMMCASCAAIANGMYFTLLRLVCTTHVEGEEPPDVLPCLIITGFTASSIASCFWGYLELGAVSSTDWIYLCIMGVIELPISFGLLNYGPGMIPACEVSLYFLLETIFGPLWLWLGGYEAPPTYAVYGGFLLITTLTIHSILAIRDFEDAKIQAEYTLLHDCETADEEDDVRTKRECCGVVGKKHIPPGLENRHVSWNNSQDRLANWEGMRSRSIDNHKHSGGAHVSRSVSVEEGSQVGRSLSFN